MAERVAVRAERLVGVVIGHDVDDVHPFRWLLALGGGLERYCLQGDEECSCRNGIRLELHCVAVSTVTKIKNIIFVSLEIASSVYGEKNIPLPGSYERQ